MQDILKDKLKNILIKLTDLLSFVAGESKAPDQFKDTPIYISQNFKVENIDNVSGNWNILTPKP